MRISTSVTLQLQQRAICSKGKLDGMAMRVPVPDGSVTDLVALLSEPGASVGLFN